MLLLFFYLMLRLLPPPDSFIVVHFFFCLYASVLLYGLLAVWACFGYYKGMILGRFWYMVSVCCGGGLFLSAFISIICSNSKVQTIGGCLACLGLDSFCLFLFYLILLLAPIGVVLQYNGRLSNFIFLITDVSLFIYFPQSSLNCILQNYYYNNNLYLNVISNPSIGFVHQQCQNTLSFLFLFLFIF